MRKTSKLSKLFALALCLVMACSMSIGAFAAEISDVEYTQKSGNCEVVTIDLDDVLAIAEEFNPNARSISAGTYYLMIANPSSTTNLTISTLSYAK